MMENADMVFSDRFEGEENGHNWAYNMKVGKIDWQKSGLMMDSDPTKQVKVTVFKDRSLNPDNAVKIPDGRILYMNTILQKLKENALLAEKEIPHRSEHSQWGLRQHASENAVPPLYTAGRLAKTLGLLPLFQQAHRDLTVAQALLLVPVATGNRSRGQLEPAQGHPHQTQSTIVGAIDQKRITIQVEEGLLLQAEKSASTMKGPN
jgi:hypothetical protein